MISGLSDATKGIDELWTPNEQTGFLPSRVPATPAELAGSEHTSFRRLGSVAQNLGRMPDTEIEDLVASLASEPSVSPDGISPTDCEAVVRAYVCLAAHLIHRPRFAGHRALPAAVARPLWSFSKHVNRPPSLTYASYVLANLTAAVRGRLPAANLQIAQTPSGTPDEEWFVAVHLSVESAGGEVVTAIRLIDKALEERDGSALRRAIESVESCIQFATETMPTVQERLDADIFRNDIRPLLYGHDQIAFRGVEGNPSITYIGETGAQSGIIRAVDAVLGARHSDAMITSMNRFLACAPPTHQRYFGVASIVGQRLAKTTNDPVVREARRAALLALARFRRTHLRVVTEFLAPQGRSLADRGTGGTNFQVWLQTLINETETAAAEA